LSTPVPHDLDRAVEVGLLQLAALGRDRLERDLEAALQVEAECRAPVDRRAGDGEHPDADQRGHQECDEDEVRSAVHAGFPG
jgi:hypothetical protein